MICFLLNNEPIEFDCSVGTARADLTVLDWLRLNRQLTGTKEGCGSGDCGACTVVLVTASDTPSGLPLNYTPAKHHGSQCGFCTPGFVMSLFALFHQNFESSVVLHDAEQRHALIEQYLGGNLCRCTGYRPIIAAAEVLLQARFNQNVTDEFDALATDTARSLHKLMGRNASAGSQLSNAVQPVTSTQLVDAVRPTTATQSIHVPASLTDALSLWSDNPGANIVAGGTDKGLEITQQLSSWSSVIHLSDIAELRSIEHNADSLVIGAGLSIAELINTLSLDYPDAVPMLLRFGSEQVRSQATIGGNLGTASPIGDLPPLLLALGASIDLVSLNADKNSLSTRTIELAGYFTGYRQTLIETNEWIQSVRIPLPTEADILRVYKISKRMDDDISSVCAAIWLQMDSSTITDVRIGFGGMAAVPARATHAETALLGVKLCEESIAAASEGLAQDFQPIDDARASAQYRLYVAQNLLKRFFIECNQPDEPTDITALAAGLHS